MRRGTTPTLKIKVEGVEVKKLTSIFFTIKQNKVEITKTEEDISIDEAENMMLVSLTQEETLDFKDGMVNVQLRALIPKTTEEAVEEADNEEEETEIEYVAIASDIVSCPIEHILMDGVIASDNTKD